MSRRRFLHDVRGTVSESFSDFYWHSGHLLTTPQYRSISTSSTLLRGSYLDRSLAESQLRSGTPFLTASDFHWAQYLLYVELRSGMSFHSGNRLVSISCRMVPMCLSFSCSVFRTSGSHSTAGTAEIARICFMSITRPCDNAYIVLCRAVLREHWHFYVSGVDDDRKWNFITVDAGPSVQFVLRGSWSSWARLTQSGTCAGGNFVPTGTCGNNSEFSASSLWQEVSLFHAIIPLYSVQCLAVVSYDTLLPFLYLWEHFSDPEVIVSVSTMNLSPGWG
jgi:hypothetical protein